MYWQEKFILLEKLALVPANNAFIGGQCDTTSWPARNTAVCFNHELSYLGIHDFMNTAWLVLEPLVAKAFWFQDVCDALRDRRRVPSVLTY